MNKRYIDFVPPKSNASVASSRATSTRVASSRAQVAAATVVPRSQTIKTTRAVSTVKPVARTATKPVTQVSFNTHTSSQKVELGVIEDLSPKFINTDTPKRPLNSGKSVAPAVKPEDSLKEAKSKKLSRSAKRALAKSAKESNKDTKKAATENSKYKPPKSPFINLDKVSKRPLSKNVYKKKTETPKEEPKGPVTIITKPEKDSHIGLIVTIILTIVLGAAAGTVAFLLLPK